MKTKKENRGGKRANQTGRPKKEPTTTISFRVKKESKKDVQEKYKSGLNKKFVEWFESL